MLNKDQKRKQIVLTVLMIALSLLFLFPVIWLIANSFKSDAQITSDMNSLSAFCRRCSMKTSLKTILMYYSEQSLSATSATHCFTPLL